MTVKMPGYDEGALVRRRVDHRARWRVMIMPAMRRRSSRYRSSRFPAMGQQKYAQERTNARLHVQP